jgi:hypothetical protein
MAVCKRGGHVYEGRHCRPCAVAANSTPEARIKQKALRDKPESKAIARAWSQLPENKAKAKASAKISQNKPENKKRRQAYASTTERKAIVRAQGLLRTYGLTVEEYNQMLIDQKGACAICNIHQTELDRILCVDHDHETGLIRGLLCSNCNTGIGYLKDSKEILINSIKYLERKEK